MQKWRFPGFSLQPYIQNKNLEITEIQQKTFNT